MNKPITGQIHDVIPLFTGKQWIVQIAYYAYRGFVDEDPYTNFEYLSRESKPNIWSVLPLNTDPGIYLTKVLIYFHEQTYQLHTELFCDNKQVGSNSLWTTRHKTSKLQLEALIVCSCPTLYISLNNIGVLPATTNR
jgi:hypothetical protein